jgi:hypothetical protein
VAVFRVMLSGRTVILQSESGGDSCGFVRNEYVWASTEELAISKAKEKTVNRLREKPGVVLLSDSPLELTVDEIERDVPLWKLGVSESFVFFDVRGGQE